MSKPPRPAQTPASAQLQFADIVLRGAGRIVDDTLKRRQVTAPYNPAQARHESGGGASDGRAILTSVALYGASRLAARSTAGFALVAGGFVLKALYDRGKARQLARRGDETAQD